MPRVANPAGSKGRAASKQALTATQHPQSPMKLSMNDDRTEKAARLQSRQALHDLQINQIKAAASPMRKAQGYDVAGGRGGSSSPRTPRSAAALARERERGKENTDPNGSPGGLLNAVSGSALTPMKRVPILANFEEWMKMATDNKINAANSWNFALIDYFHDMSLLKEGDTVNFQKASCTLDGCVKIYTSRVDSVATETGKLLSGLADSGNKKTRGEKEGEEGESGDEEEEEDGQRRKAKKKTRSHEQTLASSFASLQLKKLELEFAVDPLFKKASADFDEGGAKGLLLNHLSIDSEGRIVFDSSDDLADTKTFPNQTQMQQTLVDPTATAPPDASDFSMVPDGRPSEPTIDLEALGSKFFPDLSILDSQDICPSMKGFALGDPNSDINLPFLKAPNDWRENNKLASTEDQPQINIPLGDRSGIFLDADNAAGFDDDDDMGPLNGFDVGPDVGFGEGGEAWAKDAALEPMLRTVQVGDGDGVEGADVGDFDPANPGQDTYAVRLNHYLHGTDQDPTANILSYFDAALKSTKASSWAGPEHWRIRKIKAAQSASDNPPAPRVRKEKEPFETDFLSGMDSSLAEMLYTPASSNSAISLPKTQRKTKGRNLLPDDRHFNSRSLLGLWLKPKARIGRRTTTTTTTSRQPATSGSEDTHLPLDEAYWARQRAEQDAALLPSDTPDPQGDYDANFFADDADILPFGNGVPDDDGESTSDDGGPAGFTDAREMLSPPPDDPNALANGGNADSQQPPIGNGNGEVQSTQISAPLPGSFGAQLVTQAGQRLRPQYVNYARVAKKVDVRRLKENMWKGMSARLIKALDAPSTASAPVPAVDAGGDVDMMDVDIPAAAVPTADDTADATSGEGQGKGGPEGETLQFTSLIKDLTHVYPEQQMRDISTSYCFICLLHLANEKGLVLESADGGTSNGNGSGNGNEYGVFGSMQEISVRRDLSVGEGYVGE